MEITNTTENLPKNAEKCTYMCNDSEKMSFLASVSIPYKERSITVAKDVKNEGLTEQQNLTDIKFQSEITICRL